MKDGPEEYNESINFMKEFESIMDKYSRTWKWLKDKEEITALKTVYEYLNEDYSHLSKQEILTLMKKLSIACYEILERNC